MGRSYKADTMERMRQERRRKEVALEAYQGKRDLAKTYEALGIHNEYTHDLEEKVKRRRESLLHRCDVDAEDL